MARNKKDVIVIPWDYTESSEIALLHAIQLAKEVNNHIMLARFLESPGMFAGKAVKEKLISEEKEKLKEVGERILKEHQVNPYIAVEVGVKRSNFNKLVKDAKANLILCGATYKASDKTTFEIKDFTKRMKGIDIPFIVAVEKPAHNYYKEIVVPLDHDKKYKETLHWVVYLSKYYNCNINIIKPYIEDDYRKKEMANNIYFTKKMLDKKNIIYGIKTAKKNRQFEEEVLRFAENIDSDLIVIMIRKYSKYIADHPERKEKIPIMVINRNSQIIKYGGFR
ncbi:MAG: universal stress protein [Salinivirgaceae bacterium]|nr:universal stress protein [Salinivirgaceae bacterium]